MPEITMPHSFIFRLLKLSPVVLMSGCAAVQYYTGAYDDSDESGIVMMQQSYRGLDCDGLANSLKGMQGNTANESTGQSYGRRINVAAIQRVQVEKNCAAARPVSAAEAKPAMPPVPTAKSNAAMAAGPLNLQRLGVKVDAVPPALAAAMQLPTGRGVLVVSLQKGRPADRAGLKPTEVVLEASGQVLESPAQLDAIVKRMRDGYPLPLVVRGDTGEREVTVSLARIGAVGAPAPKVATPASAAK
ncbi:MAG: PDZ domain-containing protein [Comamonas sp.]|uniref:PDZ domain-containing protein n=1 Tax=Comamonas sp. TaxID=34028 RepID=UPI0012D0AAFC|nr:PDZ domain-containing protein [Comamonas sp.]MPS91758.1 PDZ domain-containing protein [Comamonas sp.]